MKKFIFLVLCFFSFSKESFSLSKGSYSQINKIEELAIEIENLRGQENSCRDLCSKLSKIFEKFFKSLAKVKTLEDKSAVRLAVNYFLQEVSELIVFCCSNYDGYYEKEAIASIFRYFFQSLALDKKFHCIENSLRSSNILRSESRPFLGGDMI